MRQSSMTASGSARDSSITADGLDSLAIEPMRKALQGDKLAEAKAMAPYPMDRRVWEALPIP